MRYEELPLGRLRIADTRVRKAHSRAKLSQLKKSITATRGPLIPLVVRRREDDEFDIISGDGRYQALLDLNFQPEHRVPCLVVDLSEREAIEFGLVDNVVRESMNPYEEALVARTLVEEYGLKQNEVALKLGRDKSYVSHLLHAFDLIPEVMQALKDRRIQFGHARAISTLREHPDLQKEILKRVVSGNLTVSETETEIRYLRDGRQTQREKSKPVTIWLSGSTRLSVRPRKEGIFVELLLSKADDLDKMLPLLRQKLSEVVT